MSNSSGMTANPNRTRSVARVPRHTANVNRAALAQVTSSNAKNNRDGEKVTA